MKSMKLLGGLLLTGALVGMSCSAGEEKKLTKEERHKKQQELKAIKETLKQREFSIRNTTPHRPVWVALEYYAPVKQRDIKELHSWYLLKERPCIASAVKTRFVKLDAKNPVLTSPFTAKLRVVVTINPEVEGKFYHKCQLAEEVKKAVFDKDTEFFETTQKIVFNPIVDKTEKNKISKSYDPSLKNKTFHIDVAVADGKLQINPATSSPKHKIPSNNIAKLTDKQQVDLKDDAEEEDFDAEYEVEEGYTGEESGSESGE